MRSTRFYCPTLRQAPAGVDTASRRLALRAALIRELPGGLTVHLPLGVRVLDNLAHRFLEDLAQAGSLEVRLPTSPPPSSLRSAAVILARALSPDLTSYRELPVMLHAVAPPPECVAARRGLLSSGAAGLDSFQLALGAVETPAAPFGMVAPVLEELGLPLVVAESDGTAGEFALLASVPGGDDAWLHCTTCDYAALSGYAASPPETAAPSAVSGGEPRLVETPDARTVERVCAFLEAPPQRLIKTLLYRAEDGFVAALVRGDRQLAECKLAALLGHQTLRMANEAEIGELTGAAVGFSGPVGLPDSVRVIADHELAGLTACVAGANRTDAHLVGVDVGRHFSPESFADLRAVTAGERCPRCERGTLGEAVGLVLAQALSLSAADAEAAGLVVSDAEGQQRPVVVRALRVDLGRCLAAAIEVRHDEAGLVWPRAVAPFAAAILLLDPSVPELLEAAEGLLAGLQNAGHSVLLDDRDERPGAKFKDADLLGHPVVVIVGKKLLNEGLVEVRRRRDRAERVASPEAVVETVNELLAGA